MTTRTVLVVGGAGGIGAAVADALGPAAVVWSRRGGVDAADAQSLRAALASLTTERGAPWGLVHTVGDFVERPLLDTAPADYEALVRSNLTSVVQCVQVVVPAMAAAGAGGRVVLFAAAGAGRQRGMLRAPLYFALKAAVVQLGRSLAAEVAGQGITVNVISPGLIAHRDSHRESQERMLGRVPMGRLGRPGDVVGLVQWLLSDDAAYMTGEELTVDGGLQL